MSHPIPTKRHDPTGDLYLNNRALAAALGDARSLASEAYREVHDWLVWAISLDDPPFPEDSQGEVEVGLEPGEPEPTARLSYIWVSGDGVYLRLRDIYEMIGRKHQEYVARCQEAGVDHKTRLNPFAGLKRRMGQIEQDCKAQGVSPVGD